MFLELGKVLWARSEDEGVVGVKIEPGTKLPIVEVWHGALKECIVG